MCPGILLTIMPVEFCKSRAIFEFGKFLLAILYELKAFVFEIELDLGVLVDC